ncbi:unnamed protein product [Thlaspi arvense]|uniref:Reverse transcriptase n=1 Tax=Thlaspi arvense TaxID=13288 RepID=A0AAU9SJU3_THLAR|nr:unnamed protein product [Thlaspi arvense]
MSTTFQGWNFTSNQNSDEDGHIILIWKDTIDVTIKLLTRQSITCEVKLPYGDQFYYTAIYASNLTEERSNIWIKLLDAFQYLKLNMYPWLVGGDLNQIVHPVEHSDPIVNSLDSQIMALRDSLNQMGLFDLNYQGPLFTWTNCRPSSPIAKKLDSVLVNMQVVSNFPQNPAAFLPPLISNHFPCMLNLAVPLPTVGTRPFKFFNYLTKHLSFLQVVFDAWAQLELRRFTLSNLCWKQKLIKGALKQLNRDNFSQIQVRVSESYHQLQRKFSWFSNKLLKLRDVAFTWMKRRVRDGNIIRFWSDNWTPFRSLLSFLATPCRPSRLGISQNATVSSICRNGYWAQPPARSVNFVNLQTYLTTVQLSEGEDTYEWVIKDILKKAYLTGDVYNQLQEPVP